jgi:hypothetical protein
MTYLCRCRASFSVLAGLLRIRVLRPNPRNLRVRYVEPSRTTRSGFIWRLYVRQALRHFSSLIYLLPMTIRCHTILLCFSLFCIVAGMLVAVTHRASTANSATAGPMHAEIPTLQHTDTIWVIFGGAPTARTGPQWRLMHSTGWAEAVTLCSWWVSSAWT